MVVLVTGANGFLGQNVVHLLKKEGYDVVTTDIIGEMDFVGDLANEKFVHNLPDVNIVVNCAAVQYVTKNIPWKRKEFFYKNNVQSAKNLYEKYNSGMVKFVHIGTSMMYKQTGATRYSEISPMGGEGVYSVSKLEAQFFINKINNSATIIPCIIGGVGREGLFRSFVNMIHQYGVVIFPGAGRHKVHMIHVEDVASLILKVIEQNGMGFFNAAAPDPLSIIEWIDEICNTLNIKAIKIFKLPINIIYYMSYLTGFRLLAREQLLMLKMSHVLDISKSKDLGWSPKYSNRDIVRDITRYIIKGSSNV